MYGQGANSKKGSIMHQPVFKFIYLFVFSFFWFCHANAQQENLEIYWIDVEGGAATLIVTPGRQVVLMDAGFQRDDGRDSDRIMAAMEDAGVTEIDYFLASHFHGDHVGGLSSLNANVPIKEFIDHGDSVERQDNERRRAIWENYLSIVEGARRSVVVGDQLSLDGIDFTFVTSNGEILDKKLTGTKPNPHCSGAPSGDDDSGENSRSLGYLLSLGKFQFLNLGDLTFNVQHKLACPQYELGSVDIFQVPRHGNAVPLQFSTAVNPTVAVINNGARKGGSATGFDALRVIPDLEAIWQLHRALGLDDHHNTNAQMTANLTEENDAGYWIKAVVQEDGARYELMNQRNQFSRSYMSK